MCDGPFQGCALAHDTGPEEALGAMSPVERETLSDFPASVHGTLLSQAHHWILVKTVTKKVGERPAEVKIGQENTGYQRALCQIPRQAADWAAEYLRIGQTWIPKRQ